MELLPHIELSPEQPARASIIWLHGLGANGHDFEPIVPELQLPPESPIRFIFPHAPSIPVTINAGYVMPAWYDILDMSIERQLDRQQLLTSAKAITAFIDREIERGMDSSRILIAGFSQGGAVAIETALTYPQPLAGLLCLSTYFATEATIQPSPSNQSIPVMIQHGLQDPVVPVSLGQHCFQRLLQMGYPAQYQEFAMQHAVCPPQITQISLWLQKVLLPA